MQKLPKFFGWKWPLILLVVLAEIYIMFKFSAKYSVYSLVAIILASIFLGIVFMRWEGSICWKRILYMQQHKISATEEMRDGVLIIFAGILMIIPGIITDVMGLALFLPPIRWVVRKLLLKNLYFEIPEGMESQFRIFTFSASNQTEEDQNDSSDSSDSYSQDGFSESNQESFNQDSNIQIIDVEATDPKESSQNTESETKEITFESQESGSEKQDNND